MKLMKTQDAVGQVLCHDITQIIKGVTKDAVFRKGHVITEEDIPVLLSVGKDNVYIWEKGETRLHENEAAEILREMCQGEYMHPTPVKEGKIELVADIDGLLKVDSDKMKKINGMGELMIASRHGNFAVKKGDKLAGTRIIPLVIEREKMEQAKAVCEGEPILELKPFVHKKVGIVTTELRILSLLLLRKNLQNTIPKLSDRKSVTMIMKRLQKQFFPLLKGGRTLFFVPVE